jgi:hypothetical protein
MDPASDPSLVTVKITVAGEDNESSIRKFKLPLSHIQRDVIHKTVLSLSLPISLDVGLTSR